MCRCVGKRGRATLLLKDPSRLVEEANICGITVSPHLSKVEPVAFYSEASQVYERALGGPFLVGGMKGTSLHEVARAVHRTLDMARLGGQMVDVLIGDLAKYFDDMAQDGHPVVGSLVVLGTTNHLSAHTEGNKYTMPLETLLSRMLQRHLGIPQGTIQGVHVGATGHVWSVCRPPDAPPHDDVGR